MLAILFYSSNEVCGRKFLYYYFFEVILYRQLYDNDLYYDQNAVLKRSHHWILGLNEFFCKSLMCCRNI